MHHVKDVCQTLSTWNGSGAHFTVRPSKMSRGSICTAQIFFVWLVRLMGLPLLWGALQRCILLGHVIRPLGGPLPAVFSMLGRVFPTSQRTLHFGTCFLGSCSWLLCDGTCTAVGTCHGTSGRGTSHGTFFFLFLRLDPALASHCITRGACHIIADLPGARRLHFQSLAMLEVRGHLLPQHGHFVQALPAAICCIIMATDYVIHIGLVITTHI